MASAETALRILFSNLQETGFNLKLQNAILTGSIQPQSRSVLLGKIQALGSTAPTVNADKFLNYNDSDIQEFVSKVRSVGITGVETSILSDLDSRTKAASAAISPATYDPKHSKVKLLRVNCALLAIEAGVLGLLSPPPLDAIMAAIAFYYDTMAALGKC